MTTDRVEVAAFGRRLDIERVNDGWVVFAPGNDGKRRRVVDVVIPAELTRAELVGYLDDLLHESATEDHPAVVVLE